MLKKLVFLFLALAFAVLPLAAPTYAFGPTTNWEQVQNDATMIHDQAVLLEQEAFQIRQNALAIQATETDPEVVALAGQIVELAAQTEQDAAAIAATADDINYRIDHSEATTLRLSDDIGVMADRIGVMADRILWTELQIGVMADRIVVSENLISDSTLALVQDIQETNQAMSAQTNLLRTADADIQREVAY